MKLRLQIQNIIAIITQKTVTNCLNIDGKYDDYFYKNFLFHDIRYDT